MSNPYLAYLITEIFCIIYVIIIKTRLNESIGTERQVSALKRMILAFLLVLVADINWALVEGEYIHPSHLVNAAVQSLFVIGVDLGCFFWCQFVEARLHPAYLRKKNVIHLMRIPIAVSVALDLVSIFTGWVFIIDAGGDYTTGPLDAVHQGICLIYLIIPTVVTLKRAGQTHSRMERNEYLTYSVYMLAPLAGGVVGDYIPTVPILALSLFLVIHLLFLTIQNMQIYNDALTDLNNRRRLNQFLEERLRIASPEHPVVLFMMDIDRFKGINDGFGHVEGDAALKLFAGVLKKMAARYGAFIARYGGDEFCLVSERGDCPPQAIVEDIRRTLELAQAPEDKPYILTVSIGYLTITQHEYDGATVLRRADQRLYADKARLRQGRVKWDGGKESGKPEKAPRN